MQVLIHLAGEEVGVTRNREVLGIQAKRKTVKKRIDQGKGTGGLLTNLAYPSYTYEGAEPGFAEHDLDEYDKTAQRLAWSRSLGVIRKAFNVEVELEKVWENHLDCMNHISMIRYGLLILSQWSSSIEMLQRQWRLWFSGHT